MQLWYLGTPYSHPDPLVRHARYILVTKVAAAMMLEKDVMVYSPITNCHPMADLYDLPKSWGFWSKRDIRILRICDRMMILQVPGWEGSVGLQAERKLAAEMDVPIFHTVPEKWGFRTPFK